MERLNNPKWAALSKAEKNRFCDLMNERYDLEIKLGLAGPLTERENGKLRFLKHELKKYSKCKPTWWDLSDPDLAGRA